MQVLQANKLGLLNTNLKFCILYLTLIFFHILSVAEICAEIDGCVRGCEEHFVCVDHTRCVNPNGR